MKQNQGIKVFFLIIVVINAFSLITIITNLQYRTSSQAAASEAKPNFFCIGSCEGIAKTIGDPIGCLFKLPSCTNNTKVVSEPQPQILRFTVYFDFAQSGVKKSDLPILNNITKLLQTNPKAKVRLEGHTDAVDTKQFNQTLSEQRAGWVKDYLVSRGAYANKYTVIGYGETKPVEPNKINGKDNPAGRAKNRRVQIIIEIPPAPTPIPTVTLTPTVTPTPTITLTPTVTPTPTITPTPTVTPTPTLTPTPTSTPTPTLTPTPTRIPTPTPKPYNLTLHFDFNKYDIRTADVPALNKFADLLKKHPLALVTIEGHTDAVDTAQYNLKLSQQRAQAVKDYLVRKGASRNKYTVVGYGETRPVAPNTINGKDNPDGRAKNRRVEIKTKF